MAYHFEDPLVWQMRYRLMQADDYDGGPEQMPWDHPSFKSVPAATANLLRVYPDARCFLVMNDPCLYRTKTQVLLANRSLVIPSDDGTGLLEVPTSAMTASKATGKLRPLIAEKPKGLRQYEGGVDVAVVSCLGFHPRRRRLYSFELAKTAHVLDCLRDVRRTPPVVVLASDAQQISGWPARSLGTHHADLVITSTRAVVLGSGETRPFAVAEGLQTVSSETLV